MASESCHFLWLDGIFDAATVQAYPTISAAANFWQSGFVHALHAAGHTLQMVGYPVEQAWPLGRLFVRSNTAHLIEGFDGRVSGYLNIPWLRGILQTAQIKNDTKDILQSSTKFPDYAVVFSCLNHSTEETPSIRLAKYLQKHRQIPWICIVADGATPPGADAYIFLAWSSFSKAQTEAVPAIHLDGGIPVVPQATPQVLSSEVWRAIPKQLMYMGALTEHGGVDQLVRAFSRIHHPDVELLICGRGENEKLHQMAARDNRITIKGFVPETELNRLAQEAFAFVNPRPTLFAPNRLNYPSKLLHYLAFGKPIVSTFTEGLSPDYSHVLMKVADESDDSLAHAIENCLNLSQEQYVQMQATIATFAHSRSWKHQIQRLSEWLALLKARPLPQATSP